jgi:hypothetical protein
MWGALKMRPLAALRILQLNLSSFKLFHVEHSGKPPSDFGDEGGGYGSHPTPKV